MIENIRLSLRRIWGHKMRSFLTMLGVIIGIASILAIVSIVEGTNRKLEKSLVGAGNNVTDVQVCQDGYPSTDSFQAGNMPGGIPTVSEASLEQIRSTEHVTNASLFYSRSWADSIYYQNKSSQNVSLLGVKPDYFTTCDYKLIAGRMMTEEEGKSARKVCILDEEQAENLFGTEPAVGKIIEIRKEPYTVIGVVRAANEEKKEYESLDEYHMDQWGSPGKIFVNYGSWPLIYVFDEPEGVAVQVDEAKNMAAAGAAAADILNMYVTNGNLTYQAVNTDEAANSLKTLTTAITAMLVSIASLSLLVGGIGVMNIMLVSVSERTPEIGLKKALGAKPRVIMGQFLTESAVLTSVGGVIGVLLGILIGKVIAMVISMDFAISIPWIFIAVGFSVGIGLIFGVLPARKAAKMNPIDALRRE